MKAFETTIADYTISLQQSGNNKFTVIYGLQVNKNLSYAKAAKELGEAIMHALACEGKLTHVSD